MESFPLGRCLAFPLTVLLIGTLLSPACRAADPPTASDRQAPELVGGTEWLNCSGPVYLKDLRGKVVLLDFWTYCCINCLHVLPDLARLEQKYDRQLVVIGVHSPKFTGEKDSENLRQAILRHEIEHPVINDAEHRIWKAYGVDMWPSRVLIDPQSNRVRTFKGEGNLASVDAAIASLVEKHREQHTLDETPLRFDLARYRERQDRPLFFPGRIMADVEGQRLFIADSSHHRIIITDLDGRKRDIAGSGVKGLRDGSFDQALFNEPQGMALRGNLLFVADRQNHVIRALDLEKRTVRTVAGTGRQQLYRRLPGHALRVGLNSPWDLCLVDDSLFIAMAGHHQIWKMDLRSRQIAPFAGSGQEAIEDGAGLRSKFAQPTGLTTDGKQLFVADSEGSAIRAISLDRERKVTTLVGEGLFAFGDADGSGKSARLQHCLDVTWHDGLLYVADTYNNKIKVVDPDRRSCRTFLGDGRSGHSDAPARFDEPGGLFVAGNILYVADTNNHAIRAIDIETRAVQTLALEGVPPPEPLPETPRPPFPVSDRTELSEVVLPPKGHLVLKVVITLPPGAKMNPLAGPQFLVEGLIDETVGYRQTDRLKESVAAFEIEVPAEPLVGSQRLRVSVSYYTCRETAGGVCRVHCHVWEAPVRFDADAEPAVLMLPAAPSQ